MSFDTQLAPHMAKIPSNPIFHLLPKLNEPGFISFAPGAPGAETFPYADIAKISRELLEKDPGRILQYGSTEGYPPARAAMAKLISRYGLSPEPDETIVTTGGQQAIDILCKLFIEPGDVALVESPTYSAALQILASHRALTIQLKSDENGYIPEDLEEKIRLFKPKLIYMIPTFKNPSGTTIGAERRKAAAEISGRHGVLLIEDDPYRDLRYEGEHLPTIKSFDRAGNVVFMTSVSKILCPGLRVGAAYAPKSLIPAMTVAKQAADMHSPTLTQAIVGEYVERGLLDAHIARVCAAYRLKRDALLEAISAYFPESIAATRPGGGLFVWCTCPEGVNTADILERAMEHKVAFIPGESFFAGGEGKNTFRMNFSTAAYGDIEKGAEILGRVLRAEIK